MSFSWNYRVVKHVDDTGDDYYQLHSVFYADRKVHGCSEQVTAPFGETVEDLWDDFNLMKEAFIKPPLNYEDIGG